MGSVLFLLFRRHLGQGELLPSEVGDEEISRARRVTKTGVAPFGLRRGHWTVVTLLLVMMLVYYVVMNSEIE